MILPIVAYGDPVLRKHCSPVSKNNPELKTIINNMFETMYKACGVGLAAPQIGLDIRVFIVDTSPFIDNDDFSKEEKKDLDGFKKIFINPTITNEEGNLWAFNEGCLSIPDVREDVIRHEQLTINYFDENFIEKTEIYDGIRARVIQHEYDHIEGVLFIDKINPLKKRLNQKRLQNIMDGKVRTDYKMRFFNQKKR